MVLLCAAKYWCARTASVPQCGNIGVYWIGISLMNIGAFMSVVKTNVNTMFFYV